MPHVSVKLWPGRTEEQKRALTQRIVAALKETMGAPESYITVTIEDVPSDIWPKQVYKPEILDKQEKLYKKPGYGYTDEELGIKG